MPKGQVSLKVDVEPCKQGDGLGNFTNRGRDWGNYTNRGMDWGISQTGEGLGEFQKQGEGTGGISRIGEGDWRNGEIILQGKLTWQGFH